jgi:hypothetical protein
VVAGTGKPQSPLVAQDFDVREAGASFLQIRAVVAIVYDDDPRRVRLGMIGQRLQAGLESVGVEVRDHDCRPDS